MKRQFPCRTKAAHDVVPGDILCGDNGVKSTWDTAWMVVHIERHELVYVMTLLCACGTPFSGKRLVIDQRESVDTVFRVLT